MIQNKESFVQPLIQSIQDINDYTSTCDQCGNITEDKICSICNNDKRDKTIICLVETVLELWAIDRGNNFNGLFHIIGAQNKDNIHSQENQIDKLIKRVKENNIQELIIANNNNIEGQTTAFYIIDMLKDFDVKITRLAQGIPIGGEINYLDINTINTAIQSRIPYSD